MKVPSSELATNILDRLVHEKLLSTDDQGKLLAKLADGKLKCEDWRLAIELAQEKGKKP
jgi:hypothetical protein